MSTYAVVVEVVALVMSLSGLCFLTYLAFLGIATLRSTGPLRRAFGEFAIGCSFCGIVLALLT